MVLVEPTITVRVNVALDRGAVDRELQPSRNCLEGQNDCSRVQSHGLGVGEASRVGGCQPELKVRRILMIRRP